MLLGTKISMIKNEQDYYFLYQTSGFSVLLTDVCVNTYGDFDTVACVEDGLLKYYISNHDYKVKNKALVSKIYNNFEKTIDILNRNVVDINALAGSFGTQISLTDFDKFYDLLGQISNDYSKLDHVYSDHLYTSDLESKDSLIKLVQDNKNVIREKINPVFIDNDSLLNDIVKKAAEQFGLEREVVLALTVREIRNLLKGELESGLIRTNSKNFFIEKTGFKTDYYFDAEAIQKKLEFEKSTSVEKITNLTGQTILKLGKLKGEVYKAEMNYEDFSASIKKINEAPGDKIVVVESTLPEMIPLLIRSKAIITDMGGLLSHAAISARELGIPCVVGVKQATKILKTGDVVEIDTDSGMVRVVKK